MAVVIRWLGPAVPYAEALELQARLRQEVISGQHVGTMLLLEHPHTVTIGRHGLEANVLSRERLEGAGAAVFHVARGGDVTYHGPGQLVGYPIVDLTRLKLGVSAYVRAMADVLADACADWGVDARWDADYPGLWVGADKLVAFGVHVSRGVTNHGFSLNVAPDLSFYRLIVPCGLPTRGVTTLRRLLGTAAPTMETVRDRVARGFARRFDFEYNPRNSVKDRPVGSPEGELPS